LVDTKVGAGNFSRNAICVFISHLLEIHPTISTILVFEK
jgi:hypothetical protein